MDLSDMNERLDNYLKTGEIGTRLSLCASMAVQDSKRDWANVRPELASFERERIDVLVRIANEVREMHFKMKEFEFKHWMGFCDADVKSLLELYREWDSFDWTDQSDASRRKAERLRKMWSPSPVGLDGKWDEDYWKAAWQPFLDRRDKRPLQEFIDTPRSAMTDHMKVFMIGTAGRVLITLQDRYSQGDPKSKFGGAWVTLIFDESAGWPRGGLQGQCTTRDEGIGLIQAVIDNMPPLKRDSDVGLAF